MQAKTDISISSGNVQALPEMGFTSSEIILLSRKTGKAAEISPLLTWLETRVSGSSDLENSDSITPWFSASLCPISGFTGDEPNLPVACPHSAASWSHTQSSDFGKLTNIHHPFHNRRIKGGADGDSQLYSQALARVLLGGWESESSRPHKLRGWKWLNAYWEVEESMWEKWINNKISRRHNTTWSFKKMNWLWVVMQKRSSKCMAKWKMQGTGLCIYVYHVSI